MTTIAVVKKNGWAAIASDTLSNCVGQKESAFYIVNHQKIIAIGGNWIAVAGPTSAKLALANYFSSLKRNPTLQNVADIFAVWLDLHAALKEKYFMYSDNESESVFESSNIDALIANASGIFGVSSHRAVQEFSRYYSYGSGCQYAIGAMHAVYDNPMLTAEEVVKIGIIAAAEFDDGTEAPIIIHSVKLGEQLG